MSSESIVPLMGDLLILGLKIADVLDKFDEISVEDKALLRDRIIGAKDSLTYWDEEDND